MAEDCMFTFIFDNLQTHRHAHPNHVMYTERDRKVCMRPTNRFQVETFDIRIIFNMNLDEKEEGVEKTHTENEHEYIFVDNLCIYIV